MKTKKGVQRIRDEIIKEKTSKTTKQWNKILDKFNVKKQDHTLAAKFLLEKYKLSLWWAQVVVIRYEYGKGIKN